MDLSRLRRPPPVVRPGVVLLALAGLLVGRSGFALDLPIVAPGAEIAGAAYLADRLEVRLRAAGAGAARRAGAEWGKPLDFVRARFGVASLDRLCADLGVVSVVPEFRGEVPPPAPSGEPDFTAFYLVRLGANESLEAALARFRADPEVLSADPIAVLPVSVTPNDSLWSVSYWYYQTSRRDVSAPEAWDVTTGDSSVVVAILDTGVLPHHPDLGGRVAGEWGQIWTRAAEVNGIAGVDDDGNGFVDDRYGWDFVSRGSASGIPAGEDWRDEDGDPNDYAGHGTAVAGLVGALSDNGIGITGTAWRVRLMPLRIGWSANGALRGLVDMSYVAQALRYATRMGASVINCSFATVNQSGLFEAAGAAVRAGVTLVAAAGNGGQLHELAAREDVIAVASSNYLDQISPFSNLGSYVDLCAPGDEIISTFVAEPRPPGGDSAAVRQPGYATGLDGTSFSAPIVSGAVALIQAHRRAQGLPALAPRDVLLRLRETAADISAQNPGRQGYGAGRLDLHRALTDPIHSTTKTIGALTVGAAAVVPQASGLARVVFGTAAGKLLYLEGRGDTTRVVTLPGSAVSGVAAADLPGGKAGFFIAIAGGRVAGYDRDGNPLPGWPVSVGDGSNVMSTPSLGDLDGDGAVEVVSAASGGRLWAWRLDGTRFFTGTVMMNGAIVGSVAIADFDGVPGVELVATTESGRIYAFLASGLPLSVAWPIQLGAPITPPVLTRFSSDPAAVAVVGAGPSLVALTADGGSRFSVPLTSPSGGVPIGEPMIGDLDGDGVAEIAIATTSPATLAVFDGAGVARSTLGWPRALTSEAQGTPLMGRLHSGGDTGRDLMVLNASGLLALGRTGGTVAGFPKPGGAGASASIADVDGDGRLDIVAGTGPDSVLFFYGSEGSATFDSPWPTPRGNYARSGATYGVPPLSEQDLVGPRAVTDLAADSVRASSVALAWTAPGDDGGAGRATSYDLRRATVLIDAGNFASLDSILVPAPGPAGTRERFMVTGLSENVTYYFALRTRDEAGNVSPLSNVFGATTGGGAPGRVLDLTSTAATESSVVLHWTATGDDGPSGRPRRYLVAVGDATLDEDSFFSGRVNSLEATADPGSAETLAMLGLERARRYRFAIRARDEAGNLASISNLLAVTTPVGGPIAGRLGPALASRVQPSRLPVEFYWQGIESEPAQVIHVYDISSRRVRTLPLGAGAGGVQTWNGRDDHGEIVPAGVYLARLTCGSFHVRARVVLLP